MRAEAIPRTRIGISQNVFTRGRESRLGRGMLDSHEGDRVKTRRQSQRARMLGASHV